MAKQPVTTAAPKPKPVEIILDEAEPDTMRDIAGSKSDRFNLSLINAMARTCWFPSGQSEEDRNRQLFVAVTECTFILAQTVILRARPHLTRSFHDQQPNLHPARRYSRQEVRAHK